MKILLWPSSYVPNIGGLEIMTHQLAKNIRSHGHEILVVSHNVNSEEICEMTIEGIRVCLFPFVTALLNKNLPLIKTALGRIQKTVDDFNPDTVNIHGWFECFAFYQTRIFEKRETPVCITVHGLLEQKDYNTLSCKKIWAKSKGVNTVSHSIKNSLDEMQITHPNLRVIYNGIEEKKHQLVDLKTKPPRLLMIGRLSEEKCFDVGFKALPLLLKKYPDIKLTLIGGGEKFSELATLKTSLGLENHIEMTNFVPPDRVTGFIDESSLVLIPSYYESFSLVAVESALRARPVVASSVYGLKEVVEDQKTGVLVPPHNTQDFATAIDHLLSNADKMKAMGQMAYKRAIDMFGINQTTQNYLKMYEDITKK